MTVCTQLMLLSACDGQCCIVFRRDPLSEAALEAAAQRCFVFVVVLAARKTQTGSTCANPGKRINNKTNIKSA